MLSLDRIGKQGLAQPERSRLLYEFGVDYQLVLATNTSIQPKQVVQAFLSETYELRTGRSGSMSSQVDQDANAKLSPPKRPKPVEGSCLQCDAASDTSLKAAA